MTPNQEKEWLTEFIAEEKEFIADYEKVLAATVTDQELLTKLTALAEDSKACLEEWETALER